MEIFNSSSAFKELKVFPIEYGQVDTLNKQLNINEVLFDIYEKDKEPFYIKRSEDETFIKIIEQSSVWIYGPTGCGKSNLIIRNLINANSNFIQINLAACIGLEIESFFKEILYEIASKV